MPYDGASPVMGHHHAVAMRIIPLQTSGSRLAPVETQSASPSSRISVTASATIPSSVRHATPADRRLLAFALLLVAIRFAFPLLLLNPAWEFHRDEFLYFAMGDHLEWFRMQFPPLIAVVARVGRALFGDSVWAARVPAAVAGAALLGTMLWLVRRLNGGVWSMVVLTLAGISAPVFLRPSVLMHPVIFDQLWATLAFAALVLAAVER